MLGYRKTRDTLVPEYTLQSTVITAHFQVNLNVAQTLLRGS